MVLALAAVLAAVLIVAGFVLAGPRRSTYRRGFRLPWSTTDRVTARTERDGIKILRALLALPQGEPGPELSRRLRLPSGRLYQALVDLEKRGWVIVQTDPTTGRRQFTLSERGRGQAQAIVSP